MPAEREDATEDARSRQPLSPWVPVTLLAVTTAALMVPFTLLRRQRAANVTVNALAKRAAAASGAAQSHTTSIPPPRRNLKTAALALPSASSSIATPSPSSSRLGENALPAGSDSDIDRPGARLFSVKAFGAATGIVLVSAAVGAWGVMSYMESSTPHEVARRVRTALSSRLPSFILRTFPGSDPDAVPLAAGLSVSEHDARAWTLDGARVRLADAYAREGAVGWVEAAMREAEVEKEQLRRRGEEESI